MERNDEKLVMSNYKEKDKKTIQIVFFSLIIDLLAFTMILPLLPALLDYYKETDDNGLYSWILGNVKGIQEILQAPDRFSSVLFGGKFYFLVLFNKSLSN